MQNFISIKFLEELFKLCFKDKQILDTVQHHLKYQYIPTERDDLKKILKSIVGFYRQHNNVPTIGYVSQQYAQDADVQNTLGTIKETSLPNKDVILDQLEEYIKKAKFILLCQKIADSFGNENDELIKYTAEESEKILRTSLKNESGRFVKLYEDYDAIMQEKRLKRESGDFDYDKVPFGIFPVDEATYGGIENADIACFLARSGVGKSTCLKWIGVYASRLGYDVLHIQLEDTKEKCYEKYTQVWTSLEYEEVKYGDVPNEKIDKINKARDIMIKQQRDVFIYAFEMFDEASCRDIRNLILEYETIKGKIPDLVIVDSIDLLHPGDGLKYGISTEAIKMKKENSARKLKNIAVEFNTRIVTADQASNIPKENWNDPTWVMTQNNVSGAKNLSNAFSYFITINQTEDEKNHDIIRLYFDKLRNYFPKERTVRIATAYKYGKFFDIKRTKELQESNIPIKTIKGTKKTLKHA